MSSKTVKAEELAELSDSDILKLRFKNISLSISETEVQNYIHQLYLELEAKGLTFRPQIFFGDEWFRRLLFLLLREFGQWMHSIDQL